ncbi:hypothetical protein [Kribbella sp. C-35]|uniref:hypothetical protein n=1 Tax=Kribbella sp. C-35 TaxID=2789276 RepID=UPI0039791281
MSRAEREQDLITYYSNEIQARVDRDLPEPRVARRTAYSTNSAPKDATPSSNSAAVPAATGRRSPRPVSPTPAWTSRRPVSTPAVS